VLELPTGVRDGTSSLGDFNPSAQYFQTVHRKPLVGGYLSRVSEQRKSAMRALGPLAAIIAMSEGVDVPEAVLHESLSAKHAFVDGACIAYVVIDRARVRPQLRAFAI